MCIMQWMVLSDRQKDILQKTVFEYVNTAKPVSSQDLEEHFTISPATIRNELHYLTGKGFLFQPHISSGRFPTDKGYRFFVDSIIDDIEDEIFEMTEDPFILSRNLAVSSLNLAFTYFPKHSMFLKEGWENLLREPEFQENRNVVGLAKFLNDVEEGIANYSKNELSVYIGKENPFSKIQDFSIILLSCTIGNEDGVVGIVGPTRMEYEKNIGLMKALHNFL